MRNIGAALLPLAVAGPVWAETSDVSSALSNRIASVKTNAELEATSSSAGQVLRTGYYAPGDVAPALYTASATACSHNRGAGDGGVQIPTSDGKCWITNFPQGRLPLAQFGLRCDGSSKDMGIIAMTIASGIEQNGGVHIVFPAGTCPLSSTVEINRGSVYFSGEGSGVTTLRLTGAFDAFRFSGAAFDGGVSDLRIESAVAQPSAGFALRTQGGVGAIAMSGVRIEGTFGGLHMANPPVSGVVKMHDVHFSNLTSTMSADTIRIEGASQLFLSNVDSYQTKPNRACLHFLDVSAAYLSNVTCGGSGSGLLIDPSKGQKVFDIFATNLEIDNSQGTAGGLILDSTRDGAVWGLRLSNVRVGYGSGPGIVFRGKKTSHVTLTNFSSERNLSSGLIVDGLQDSQITDGQLLGNGAGGKASVGLDLRQADRAVFARLRASANYPGQTASAQEVGIAVANGFTGSAQIRDGDLSGNTKEAMINAVRTKSIVVSGIGCTQDPQASCGQLVPTP